MTTLKILSIGSDRKLFEEGSAVSERIKEYGKLVEELHIVVFAHKSLNLKEKKLSENVWVYPSNSSSRWLYMHDAIRIGKKIVVDKHFIRGESVVTTQDPFESGWVGLKIKNKWRIPLEIQLHTDPFSPYFSGWLNKVRMYMARRTLASADHIRVVSETVGSQLLKSFPNKKDVLSVLPIYVDKERIERTRVVFDIHARYGWHFIILSVARLTVEKNLGLALDVLQKVRTVFPDAGLVIVGSGPEEKHLQDKAKELGIEKYVAFAGWQEELGSYYQTANLFLQTSLFEGYGLSLVEAGLSGLPVVSTPVGIARDLENGKDIIICPHDDPDYMSQLVCNIIENKEKRDELKANMKHTLESTLISKEEYFFRLLADWKEVATHVSA